MRLLIVLDVTPYHLQELRRRLHAVLFRVLRGVLQELFFGITPDNVMAAAGRINFVAVDDLGH